MNYPYKKYRYRLEIEGIEQAGFSEVSAPDASIEPIKYREGDYPHTGYIKMPGLIEYSNVTLKWGISDATEFFEWISNVAAGTIERKTVTIILIDDEGGDKCTWVLENAWPCKYTAPDFSASSNEVAFESIELAHEGMKREK